MRKTIGSTVASLMLFAAATSAAERTPSLPDWSGVWINITGSLANPGFKPLQTAMANPPPLQGEYEKRWAAARAAAQSGEPTTDPGADCIWPGVPGISASTMPQEFLITRDRVGILYESTAGFRLIYTDGRKVPEDLDASYNGFSIGRWEGDTLVVDTVGLRADTILDPSGAGHSDQLTVRERFRKIAPDVIENELTMTDPKAFTKPWTAKIQYRRMAPGPGDRIIEYVCWDNNRNGVGADGVTYTLGPDGKPIHGTLK